MPPKKANNTNLSEKESFQNFLTSLEEEPGLTSEEEEEEDEEEEEALLEQDEDEDDEDDDELEDDDNNDDDIGPLNEWMQEDDQFIEDSEITELLNASIKKREQLKTGGQEEIEKDMEEFDNNLTLTSGIGRLKKGVKKRLTTGEIRLPEDVKRKLGEANALYVARDYGNAIAMLQGVITDHPNAYPAWNTLGLIHDELGNKDKSLQMRMVAAHLCLDPSLWKELAQKSIENNAPKQAIYCLSKALNIDPTDVDALWDRSFLYKQTGKNAEAVEGFNKILYIMPHHFKVINELAQLYRAEGKTKEAIKMYEEAIVYHTENADPTEEDDEEEEEFKDKLGYSEINMLSELYLILNDYARCLDTIKTGLRLVQHRQDETWWVDHIDDDDEYFEEDEARVEFPIELRVRMGVCRVYLGQVQIATKHFGYLLQYPPTTYPDLHQDIAYAYYDRRHYDLALKVFQRIIDASDEIEVDLLIRTADCYREVGDLDTAVVFYVNVLDEQPENLDVMVSLATVYEEQGKEEQALDLVEYVMKKNRETRKLNKERNITEENKAGETEVGSTSKKASIFDEAHHKTKKDEIKLREAQKLRAQQEKEVATKAMFEKLSEMDKIAGPNVLEMDRTLIRDYMRTAQELWDVFWSTRAFYPSRRSVRYEGFYAARRGKSSQEQPFGEDAQLMAHRLRQRVKREDDMEIDIKELDEEEKEDLEIAQREIEMSAASQFLDIPFDQWCRVFLKYAYMLAMTRRAEEANDLIKKASEANVFFHNVKYKVALKLALIGCGLVTGNSMMTQVGARWLCNFYQFQNDPFKVYTAVLVSGRNDSSGLVSYPQLKYVSRLVRLMDALIANSKEGAEINKATLDEIKELDDAVMAMNVDPSSVKEQNYMRFYEVPSKVDQKTMYCIAMESLDRPNPILLTLFGHLMNLSRNHLASTLFYMRSYAVAPLDPVNTLCLGLSFIQASVQRRCDNRHLMIMQGMLFILEYVKIMGRCQESEYNLALCFHILGLTHLAVPHYERVLCLPSKSKAHIEKEKPIEEVYTWPVDDTYDMGDDDVDDDVEYDETDLKHEAAYNLHLIYVTSGSTALAEIVMMKYCTI